MTAQRTKLRRSLWSISRRIRYGELGVRHGGKLYRECPWTGPEDYPDEDNDDVTVLNTPIEYTDIYKTSLLGVGDLEKRLGRKKFNEVLGKYVVKPAGAPTLVPETDPRKPYSDAASDFNQ